MYLDEIVWKEAFAEKIERKHNVSTAEVEQVLGSRPKAYRAQKGRVPGEDLFAAYGQTEGGRYLVVFFIRKDRTTALPISARDMTARERRSHEKRKRR